MKNIIGAFVGLTACSLMLLIDGGCAARQQVDKEPVLESQPVSITPNTLNIKKNQKDTVAVDKPVTKKYVSTPFGVVSREVPDQEMDVDVFKQKKPSTEKKGSKEKTPYQKDKYTNEAQENLQHPNKESEPYFSSQEKGASEGGIFLNFDEADLIEVIRNMSELLSINYITDPGVRGKVTIHTAGEIKNKDLWSVFFQILEINGLTAIREGNLYRITPMKDAARLPILSRYGRESKELHPSERMVMQIIPLKHVDVAEMVKVLTPFISAEGTVLSYSKTNMLMIVDKGLNVLKALRLVDVFDVDFFDEIKHRFYFFEYADAEDVTQLFESIIKNYDNDGKLNYKLIPINRLNALLAISEDERVFDKIESMLKVFDSPSDLAQKRIYVYTVKNGEANELGELLNNIFVGNSEPSNHNEISGKIESEIKEKPLSTNPFMKPVKSLEKEHKTNENKGGMGNETGTLRDVVKITPDEVRNSIVIEATPADYHIIESLLARLDVMPRQVLIEMTIAEVKLDDETKLGVDWNYLAGDGGPSTSVLKGSLSGADPGFSFTIGEKDRWSSILQTFALDNRVNILSTPSILATDNKEATIDIADEIPIVSSNFINTETNIITTTVQYRDTGLLLKVTPHINENGLVRMDISQEFSRTATDRPAGGAGGGDTYPSFSKRTVTTSLAVRHRQAIIIGGLISEEKTDGKSGMPILSKLPGLGFIFGSKTYNINKKELIILIVPHVIINLDDVDEVTNEFKKKMSRALVTMH